MPTRPVAVALLAFAIQLSLPSAAAVRQSGDEHPGAATLGAPIGRALDAVQRIPGATPAVAATIVSGDSPPWYHVRGPLRAGGDVQADAATQFYIASQTKSFMGLLAAVLDRKGVLPLDTTLSRVWPRLRLPAPADPTRITMADLLSHQEGLTTETLNFVTAYVHDVPSALYPQWLETQTSARTPGFRYANLGDLVYAAALETHTGRNWHDWLDEAVLRPLQLQQGISSRTSTFPADRIAWNHQWDGRQWHAFAPKPDTLMHAAGGLLASPEAMGRWMELNLGLGEGQAGVLPADFAQAQRPIAVADLADGEIDCDGYSLGWYSCLYRGQRALMHPGSYVGTVSVTVLVPAARAGLSLVVNSDSAMEGFELEVMKAFIGLATGQAGEEDRLAAAVAAYPGRLDGQVQRRHDAMEEARNDPAWGDWQWQPDAAQVEACTGDFHDPLFGTLAIRRTANRMVADLEALHLALEPATPGVFAASDGTLDPPDPLVCRPDTHVVKWRGQTFQRRRGATEALNSNP